MEFESGVFKKFRAVTKVHLGGINQELSLNSVVEYDGSNAKIGGQTYNLPALAGAIKVGWLVPIEDKTSTYHPRPAGVEVRPATSTSQERGAPMTVGAATDDEVQVGSLKGTNQRRKEALDNQFSNLRGEVPVEAAPPAAKKYQTVTEETPVARKYQVVEDEAPVEISYPMSDGSKPGIETVTDGVKMMKFGTPQKVVVGVGQSDTSLKESVEQEAADRLAARARATRPSDAEIRQAARKRELEKQSLTARTNADSQDGQSIHHKHASGATGDVDVTLVGDDLVDLLPDAISTGRPKAGVVRDVDSFTWDKSPHWRTRVKVAVEQYGADPSAISQILAMEDPSVVKFIKDALLKR